MFLKPEILDLLSWFCPYKNMLRANNVHLIYLCPLQTKSAAKCSVSVHWHCRIRIIVIPFLCFTYTRPGPSLLWRQNVKFPGLHWHYCIHIIVILLLDITYTRPGQSMLPRKNVKSSRTHWHYLIHIVFDNIFTLYIHTACPSTLPEIHWHYCIHNQHYYVTRTIRYGVGEGDKSKGS